MSTSTATRTVTRIHTAIHLTNAVLGAIAEILSHLGISAQRLLSAWDTDYEPALRAWIHEGSLAMIVLECQRPDGTAEPIFEFPIEYTADGSAALSHRHIALARQWLKLSSVPSGTTYRVLCTYNGWHSDQPGWTDATRASTTGMRSVSLGTLAAGPYAAASVRYLTR